MRDARTFGDRLRALRGAQKDGSGWSLEFASAEIGIAKGSLQSYETGKFPPIDVADKIVQKYGSDLSYAWYGRLDFHERPEGQPDSFRLQTRRDISTAEARLLHLKISRVELIEHEQRLAAEKRSVLDEEIRALEEEIRKGGGSDSRNG